MPSHYTQNNSGGKACVYKLRDYNPVLTCLKNSAGIEVEGIPWVTLNVVEKLSHSIDTGRWNPCRPEHFSDEVVDEMIGKLPKSLLDVILPFQLEGVRFGLRRGGRCLIADEMGLGKTLQVTTQIMLSMSHCLLNIFLTFWDCSFWYRFLVMPFRWFENVLSEIKRSLTMLHFSMHNLFAGYCNCSLFHKCRFYTCCMSSNFTSFMGRRIGALASLLFACRYSSW